MSPRPEHLRWDRSARASSAAACSRFAPAAGVPVQRRRTGQVASRHQAHAMAAATCQAHSIRPPEKRGPSMRFRGSSSSSISFSWFGRSSALRGTAVTEVVARPGDGPAGPGPRQAPATHGAFRYDTCRGDSGRRCRRPGELVWRPQPRGAAFKVAGYQRPCWSVRAFVAYGWCCAILTVRDSFPLHLNRADPMTNHDLEVLPRRRASTRSSSRPARI
mgnify:CR=1 FL=1